MGRDCLWYKKWLYLLVRIYGPGSIITYFTSLVTNFLSNNIFFKFLTNTEVFTLNVYKEATYV